jgi:hypothetical protein
VLFVASYLAQQEDGVQDQPGYDEGEEYNAEYKQDDLTKTKQYPAHV